MQIPSLVGLRDRLFMVTLVTVAVAGCGATAPSQSLGTAPVASTGDGPTGVPAGPTSMLASSAPIATDDAASEPPGGTTSGDIPDNAVFLSYSGGEPAFSIDYVEGWQVNPRPDGVVIRDKDSSETVAIVALPSDLGAWIMATDLPGLQAEAGFTLVKQDRVKVGAFTYDHLVYHLPAPPDPVTGKRVPSTVDRYYVPGSAGLAVVSLSTPDGIDNVDGFRQMIESFKWR